MKIAIFKFVTLAIVVMSAHSVFADVKIKSKQTMAGQTFENTTYIKGKRQRAETMNGMSINITQCDMRRGVQLNTSTKTYMVNPFATTVDTKTTTAATRSNGVVEKGGKVTMTITTKDTGERKQMFGFTARHLIITTEMVSSPDACSKNDMKMQADGWYIDFEPQFDCDQTVNSYSNYNGGKPGGCQDKYEIKSLGTGKRGYPLYEKMTMFDGKGKETMSYVNEVIELSKATLDAGLFDIPAGYKEVSDPSAMYNVAGLSGMSPSKTSTSTVLDNMQSGKTSVNAAPLGPKKAGVIRIGLADVKTGAVGEGLNASDLATAVQNSMVEKLKLPNVEVVKLETKAASMIDAEAKQKDCDYVVYINVSHKKGGGGFGMFSKVIAPAIGATGIGGTGSTAGNIAGSVATNVIVNAGSVAGNVKSKDEITLDLKLSKTGGAETFAKVYKAKAKTDGEDIITPVIQQAAQAVIDATRK